MARRRITPCIQEEEQALQVEHLQKAEQLFAKLVARTLMEGAQSPHPVLQPVVQKRRWREEVVQKSVLGVEQD